MNATTTRDATAAEFGFPTDVPAAVELAPSATYSPVISIGATDEPDLLLETFLQVSGDPGRLNEIVGESLVTLAEPAAAGPTEAELDTANEQLTLEYDLGSKERWVEQMLFSAVASPQDRSVLRRRVEG